MFHVRPIVLGLLVGATVYGAVYVLTGGQLQKNTATLVDTTTEAPVVSVRLVPTGAKLVPKPIGTTLAPVGTTSISPTPIPYTTISTTTPIPLKAPSPSQVPMISPTVTATPIPTPVPLLSPPPSPSPTPNQTATDSPLLALTPSSLPENPQPAVVINEIAWMGTDASATDEWIELYNSGLDAVDLAGWRILIAGDNSIALSGLIDSSGYYLLERTNNEAVNDVAADYAGPFGRYGLGDSGERLTLVDPTGATVDEVNGADNGWLAGTKDKGSRSTMERISPDLPGSGVENWASNNGALTIGHDADGGAIRGTPRSKNSVTD